MREPETSKQTNKRGRCVRNRGVMQMGCRHLSLLRTCMGEVGPDEGESDLSSPPLPPFKEESISRRPKLTRFIQLKPPFLFVCVCFVICQRVQLNSYIQKSNKTKREMETKDETSASEIQREI